MGSRNTERGQATGTGGGKGGKRAKTEGKDGMTKEGGKDNQVHREIPKETLGRGHGCGDTREEMKEEVGGKAGEWERAPSLRPGSPNTEVGGDGATRPKWGHRIGWGGLRLGLKQR